MPLSSKILGLFLICLAFRSYLPDLGLPYASPSMLLTFFIVFTWRMPSLLSPLAAHLHILLLMKAFLHDPSEYRRMVGALQYLTFTRPDLSFSVHQLCQFMQHPTTSHFDAAKRVLHYVRGTLHFRIHIDPGPITLLAFSVRIGLVTHQIGNPLLASWSFLVLVQFLGLPRSNPQSHDHPLKLSIAHLHPLLLNWPGFVLFSENLVCLFHTFLFSGVTTILQLPWLPTLCFILGRSTLK